MRYDVQVIFDKGYENLAYQLEALFDKAPEISDDLDNLVTQVLDDIEYVEDQRDEAYDEGYESGYDNGYHDGEFEADDRYDDGHSDGYDEGFDDGYEAGQAEASEYHD